MLVRIIVRIIIGMSVMMIVRMIVRIIVRISQLHGGRRVGVPRPPRRRGVCMRRPVPVVVTNPVCRERVKTVRSPFLVLLVVVHHARRW